jgi:hypothetical protein
MWIRWIRIRKTVFFSITHCTKCSRVRSMIFLPWQPSTQEHIKKRQVTATSRDGATFKNAGVNFAVVLYIFHQKIVAVI